MKAQGSLGCEGQGMLPLPGEVASSGGLLVCRIIGLRIWFRVVRILGFRIWFGLRCQAGTMQGSSKASVGSFKALLLFMSPIRAS